MSSQSNQIENLIIRYIRSKDVCPIISEVGNFPGRWPIFFDLLERNRLLSLAFHLLVCKLCKKTVPVSDCQWLFGKRAAYLLYRGNYNRILQVVYAFFLQKKVPYMLLKEFD